VNRGGVKAAVFEAATECARTGRSIVVAESPDAVSEDFEQAFAEWRQLGGKNVRMRVAETELGSAAAEFTRVDETAAGGGSLADALRARTAKRTRDLA
jgi:hypothetical protein